MRACLLLIATLLLPPAVAAFAVADDPWQTPVDRKVLPDLKGRKQAKQIVFHYKTGDIDPTALKRAFRVNQEKFDELEGLLQMKYEGKVHVFLYRDGADLEARTGSGAVAFSTGTVSVHQPVDFESVHELTHIFALQLPKDEDAHCDLFVVEGLATMLARVDGPVPIHSWAAVYARNGKLPPLLALRRTFPDGAPAGVHPYHVAGSFVGYLIDRFGMPDVKRWYVNSTEAYMVFGETLPRLEREWRDWLNQVEVDPEHERYVLEKLGLLKAPMPEAYAEAKGRPLFDGKSLRGLKPDADGVWRVEDGHLVGEHDGPWSVIASTRGKTGQRWGARVRFRMIRGDAFKIIADGPSGKSEAIFAAWSTFLSVGGGFVPNGDVKVTPGQWYDVVLVNDAGTGGLYLNGVTVLGPIGPLAAAKGTVGLGIEKGEVEIASFELFDL